MTDGSSGTLIPGFAEAETACPLTTSTQIAAVYRDFERYSAPDEVPGFCDVATIEEIRDDTIFPDAGALCRLRDDC